MFSRAVTAAMLGVNAGIACANIFFPKLAAFFAQYSSDKGYFMAALVMAYLSEFSTEKAARCGLAAAAICIEGENTINEKLSRQAVLDRISEN